MTADNKIEVKFSQDLSNGEVSILTSGRINFPIALQLCLTGLKGLKDKLQEVLALNLNDVDYLSKIRPSLSEDLHSLSDAELPEAVLTKAEEEMYDLFNYAVSSFLDSHFPRVNSQPSLTELAAQEAGLDRSATPEQLVEAEKMFMETHPEIAATTQDLAPGKVIKLDKENNLTAADGGLNREQRRKLKLSNNKQ